MSSSGSDDQPNLQPNFKIVGQYIKDLSFENPNAPVSLSANPEMDLGIDLHARPVSPDHFEVVLSLRVKASQESKSLFMLELAYAALVRLVNIPEEASQQILLIQVPHLIFPFARRIVADMVRDGGMPPLVIEPIDFVGIYRSRMAQAEQAPAGTA